MTKNHARFRFWLQTVIGGAAATCGLVTLMWADWIEAIFGTDPDQHSGSAEWLVVAVLFAVAVVLGGMARTDWRRLGLQRLAAESADR